MRYPPAELLAAARTLLGKTQEQVSAGSGVSRGTVNNVEHSEARLDSVEPIVSYYEREGLEFLKPEGDAGWGLRANFLRDGFRNMKRQKNDASKQSD